MGGKLEGSSFFSSSSSKRRRRPNNDYAKRTKTCSCSHGPKQHLYLALDDWNGGYSIHKLGIDDILDHRAVGGGEHKHNLLEEAAAVRITSPVPGGPMAFAALGTTIFIGTNPDSHEERAPPTLVYDTKAGAVTVGPRVPNKLRDLSSAMAVGETLYALTSVPFPEWSSLQALSWAPTAVRYPQPWDPAMEWSWNTVPSPLPPPYDGIDIVAYALHPDGHTIFMSTEISTRSLDTRNGVWKDLGDWVLPFRGQAFFDANLDAWVGLHHVEDGYVCCCPVVSRRTAATRSPECRILVEKLIHRKEVPKHWACLRGKDTSLTYMGDSSYAFVENILRSEDFKHGSVLHITLFSLRYDHKGDLRTKVRHATRSYQVSKNTPMFSHAAFWM